MPRLRTFSFSKVWCSFCGDEPADKCIQFSSYRYWVVCDLCLSVMTVGVYSEDWVTYQLLVTAGDVFVVLASTDDVHDPIFLYMASVIRGDLERSRNLLLSA